MRHDNKTFDHEGFLLVNYTWQLRNFTGKVKFLNGDKVWYKDGHVHREDGPAIIRADGDKFWYKNNQFHREDGPAVEFVDGRAAWWYDGKIGLNNFPTELKKKLTRKFLT